MNDFLQNLKSQNLNKERRFNKSKNIYEGNTQERRGGQEKRPAKSPRYSTGSGENQALQLILETLVETQKDKVFIENRKIEAEERKTKAMERLSSNIERLLNNLSAKNDLLKDTEKAERKDKRELKAPELPDANEEDVRKTSRQYVIKLIKKFRKENMTYEHIAAYLTENGFPTFSGRGRWHAQTIHRICQ